VAASWNNSLLRFARLAMSVARRVLPDRSCKFASGPYTQPQLLACLHFKEHLGLTYRRAGEVQYHYGADLIARDRHARPRGEQRARWSRSSRWCGAGWS
jgi:hypothetical protein